METGWTQIFKAKHVPKENASYQSLSFILLDSVIRVNKKHSLQTLLEKCRYEIEKNKVENVLDDDLYLSSSDNETDNESDNDKSNE